MFDYLLNRYKEETSGFVVFRLDGKKVRLCIIKICLYSGIFMQVPNIL